MRDNDAVSNNPITIGDKKALEGPWIDIQDGILNTDGSTEYFPMIAQRVYRQDPVEIANNWNRNPNQILLYMSISAGNFING